MNTQGLNAVSTPAASTLNSPSAVSKDALQDAIAPLRYSQPRIVIVGGGVAGLTTAYELKKLGIHAEVYEADPKRLGGRLYTDKAPWGDEKIERGGQFINEGHQHARTLAQEIGVNLINLHQKSAWGEDANTSFCFEGTTYGQAEFLKAVGPLIKRVKEDRKALAAGTLREEDLDSISILDYVDRVEISPWARRMFDLLAESELGRTCGNLSAYLFLSGEFPLFGDRKSNVTIKDTNIFEPGYGRYVVEGGTEKLIAHLSQRVSDSIHLDRRLQTVVYQPKTLSTPAEYTLEFQDRMGRSHCIQANIVIMTLPYSVLRSVDTSKMAMTDERAQAITQLPYAHHVKMSALLKSVPKLVVPDEHQLSDAIGTSGGLHWSDIPSDLSLRDRIRTALLVDRDEPDEALRESITRALDVPVEGVVSTRWKKMPLAKGSYSTHGPGNRRLAPGLTVQDARTSTFYAGEHITPSIRPNARAENKGFIEGAIESAKVTAAEVARHMERLRSALLKGEEQASDRGTASPVSPPSSPEKASPEKDRGQKEAS